MKKLEDKYYQIIKQHYPDVTQRKITVRDYGWDYQVGIVNDKVFRFPRYSWVRRRLNRQIRFAEKYRNKLPLPIPCPVKHKSGEIIYTIHEFIPGDPLKPLWLQHFSQQNQEKIAKQLGRFLHALHTIPMAPARKLGLKKIQPITSEHDSIPNFQKRLKGKVTAKQWQWIRNRLQQMQQLIRISRFKPVVVHRDIAPQHVLMDRKKQQLTGIIDFGDLGLGDPALDFFRLDLYPDEFVEQVIKYYDRKLDNFFHEREQAYRDLSLFFCLDHYTKRGMKHLVRKFKKQLAGRMEKL